MTTLLHKQYYILCSLFHCQCWLIQYLLPNYNIKVATQRTMTILIASTRLYWPLRLDLLDLEGHTTNVYCIDFRLYLQIDYSSQMKMVTAACSAYPSSQCDQIFERSLCIKCCTINMQHYIVIHNTYLLYAQSNRIQWPILRVKSTHLNFGTSI